MDTEHEPGFPLNRIVAFAGPYISIVAGFIATWLVEHLEFLHLDAAGTTGAIINLITFGLTAVLAWAGQHKWLDGWQKWESAVAGPAVSPAGLLPGEEDIDDDDVPHPVSAGQPGDEPLPPEGAVGGKPGESLS